MNPILQKNYLDFFFEKRPTSKITKAIVFVIFSLVFLYLKFAYHELWKDEWQAWHVARDMSWGEICSFLYYEGHPSLWYIYLKIIALCTPLGADLFALQASHALLILTAFAIFFFRFRFSLPLKIAFLLSSFCYFEYGMVNRGYALVMLLAFWAATLIENKETNIWKLCLALFLLCQTEAQGVIIAGGLWVFAFAKNLFDENFKAATQNKENQLLLLAFGAGFLFFVLSVYPRGEYEDLARAYNMMKQPLSESIPLAFQGLLANTFWIGSIDDTGAFGVSLLGIIFSVIILLSIVYIFHNNKNALLAMLAGLIAFFLFAALVYGGGVRQWGMLFVFFLAIFNLYEKKELTFNGLQSIALIPIIVFPIYYNIMALQKEIQYPFSNAEKTANFLATSVPAKVPIVAINPFETGAVIGYLGESRKVYKMPEGETFTWFKWLSKVYIPSENELKLFAQFKNVGGIIILTHNPLAQQRYPTATLWKAFDTYSIKNEKFYIYTLAK